MIDDTDKLHLECSCGGHALHIEKYDKNMAMWYLAFWQQGYHSMPSWRYQLKCIWHIIKYGHPYGDEIMLNEKELIELQKFTTEQLKKIRASA